MPLETKSNRKLRARNDRKKSGGCLSNSAATGLQWIKLYQLDSLLIGGNAKLVHTPTREKKPASNELHSAVPPHNGVPYSPC